jgi:uncharacterized protein
LDILLSELEGRVLGSLIEKERTTPEQYPLSMNAITLAANQKSNREPVMNVTERDIRGVLESLGEAKLVREHPGSRVSKFAHRLNDGLGLRFDFSRNELGVICVLLLRGPQTPGEIRSRSGRLSDFASLDAVEEVLDGLMSPERGPYVTKLALQPGRKEARFAHLFCGPVDEAVAYVPRPASSSEGLGQGPEDVPTTSVGAASDRMSDLEELVLELSDAHAQLQDRVKRLEKTVATLTGA